jgi:hypothetical protein
MSLGISREVKNMRWITRLVVMIAALVIGQPAQDSNVYILADGKPCPQQGDSSSASVIALDVQKNRATVPTAGDIDRDVTLGAMLAPGDDINRFDGNKGATVLGIVVRVKEGSVETCNCRAQDPIDRDTHIELALSADAPAIQRVITEVTPRFRKKMKDAGTDWSTGALQGEDGKGGIVGKWVRITGWLFFDEPHERISENTNPGGAHNVRATCWEIHPITALDVLDAPPPNAHELHPELLSQFQKAQAKTVARSPSLREQIAKQHAALLKKFGAKEVREEEEQAQVPPKPEEIRKAKSLRN